MKASISLAGAFLASLFLATMPVAGTEGKGPQKPLAGYSSIVVGVFEVDKNPATEDFPKGLETLMQSKTVNELRDKKIFPEVLDGSATQAETAAGQESPSSGADPQKKVEGARSRQLVLSSTVIKYDKGNRTARYLVGFGAGESHLKIRFVVRDAGSGAELLQFEQQGTFNGMFSTFGGNDDAASINAASGVVSNLIKELKKNR